MGGEWRDDRPEAQPDFWSFRPQSDHPHWIDLAMNDIADSIRGSGAEQPDWQRWTVITDDLPLAAVYPPGVYFEGWSSAAQVLGVTRAALSAVLNERAHLSPEMALRVEKAFGVSMDTLMRMQNSYDIAQARKREGEINVAPFKGKPLDPQAALI